MGINAGKGLTTVEPTVEDLLDVSVVSPANGDVLVYNSTTKKWMNESASADGYVPYTGATNDVNLGTTYGLTLGDDGLVIGAGYNGTMPPAGGMIVQGVSVFGGTGQSGPNQVQVTNGLYTDNLVVGYPGETSFSGNGAIIAGQLLVGLDVGDGSGQQFQVVGGISCDGGLIVQGNTQFFQSVQFQGGETMDSGGLVMNGLPIQAGGGIQMNGAELNLGGGILDTAGGTITSSSGQVEFTTPLLLDGNAISAVSGISGTAGAIDLNNGLIEDGSSITKIDWLNDLLTDNSAKNSLIWGTGNLVDQNGTTTTASWRNGDGSFRAGLGNINLNIGSLPSLTGINAKTVANTTAFTNASGHTFVPTAIVVRCTAASAITNGPTVGFGNASGTNNIANAVNMMTLTTTSSIQTFSMFGAGLSIPNGGKIWLNLGTAATGTSQTIACDIQGYFV